MSILNVAGFYDGLLAFLDGVVGRGFLRQEHRGMLIVAREPDDLVGRLRSYVPPSGPKWITAGER